jgi:hypothetical protein
MCSQCHLGKREQREVRGPGTASASLRVRRGGCQDLVKGTAVAGSECSAGFWCEVLMTLSGGRGLGGMGDMERMERKLCPALSGSMLHDD